MSKNDLALIKQKVEHLKGILSEVRKQNNILNDLLHEKKRKTLELNQKIEYLLQEQKYEILELINSEENIELIKNRIIVDSDNKNM